MAVTVIVETQVKPEHRAELEATFREAIADTRAYDGCHEFNIHINREDDCNWVFFERWESREHYDRYIAWRMESGFFDRITAMLAGEPSFRYFDASDM